MEKRMTMKNDFLGADLLQENLFYIIGCCVNLLENTPDVYEKDNKIVVSGQDNGRALTFFVKNNIWYVDLEIKQQCKESFPVDKKINWSSSDNIPSLLEWVSS
jgi:hypothetical protein